MWAPPTPGIPAGQLRSSSFEPLILPFREIISPRRPGIEPGQRGYVPHEPVEHGSPSLEVAVQLLGRQIMVEQLDDRVRPVRGQHDLHSGRAGRERAFARYTPGEDHPPRRCDLDVLTAHRRLADVKRAQRRSYRSQYLRRRDVSGGKRSLTALGGPRLLRTDAGEAGQPGRTRDLRRRPQIGATRRPGSWRARHGKRSAVMCRDRSWRWRRH